MRKYPAGAGAQHRALYGIALTAGLEQFEATRPLAAGFRTINDALIALQLEKSPLLTALTVARAGVRVGDYQFDRVVRQIDRACQLADGGARGPVFRAVFPDHVSCVVSPTGVGQVAAGDAFVRRLEAAGVEGVAAIREAWLPELKTRLADLKAAVAARDEAGVKLAGYRAREEALCEDHELALERVMGQVRTLYPRQRDLWNAIFPPADRPREAPELDDDPAPTPEA